MSGPLGPASRNYLDDVLGTGARSPVPKAPAGPNYLDGLLGTRPPAPGKPASAQPSRNYLDDIFESPRFLEAPELPKDTVIDYPELPPPPWEAAQREQRDRLVDAGALPQHGQRTNPGSPGFWKAPKPKQAAPPTRDYNYDAARAAGIKPGPNGHWPDTYKLPNHITFSTDSQYSTPNTPGGEWRQVSGKWHYKPSAYVLGQHGEDALRRYFAEHEPDAVLELPSLGRAKPVRATRSQRQAREAEQLERERQHRGNLFGLIPMNLGADVRPGQRLSDVPGVISDLAAKPVRWAGQAVGELGEVGSRLVAPALHNRFGDVLTQGLQGAIDASQRASNVGPVFTASGPMLNPVASAKLFTPAGVSPRAWHRVRQEYPHLAEEAQLRLAHEFDQADALAKLQGDDILGPRTQEQLAQHPLGLAEEAGRRRVAAEPERNWAEQLSSQVAQVPGAYMFDPTAENIATQQLRRNPNAPLGAIGLDMLAAPNPLALVPGGALAKLPGPARAAANILGAGTGVGSELPVIATRAAARQSLKGVRKVSQAVEQLAQGEGRLARASRPLAADVLGPLSPDYDLAEAMAAGARETLEPAQELEQALVNARRAREGAVIDQGMADYARTRQTAQRLRKAERSAREAARNLEIAQLEHLGDMAGANLQANLRARRGMPELAQAEQRAGQRLLDQAEVTDAFRDLQGAPEPNYLDQILGESNRLKTAEELRQQRRAGGWRPTFEDDAGVGEARAVQQANQRALHAERELGEEASLRRRLENLEQLAARQQAPVFEPEAARSGLLGPRGDELSPDSIRRAPQLQLPEPRGPRRSVRAEAVPREPRIGRPLVEVEPGVFRTPEELAPSGRHGGGPTKTPARAAQSNYLDGVLGTEPPPPARRPGGSLEVERVSPHDVQVDARAYQFKAGGDIEGVTDRLRDVERWDPTKAGVAVVHERLDGSRFIADGHQRLGLAKRVAEQGQDAGLNAIVLREADGFSVADARRIAAAKNLAEGSGTATDAAKLIRQVGADSPDLATVPRSSAVFRDGRELAKLGDEAFEAVVNRVVPEPYAAHVGRLLSDPAEQVAALRALARIEPRNSAEALSIVSDIRAQGLTRRVEQGGLFGAQELAEDLLAERARIFSAAQQLAAKDRSLFSAIVRGESGLEEAGNQLAKTANRERITDAERVLAGLEEAKYVGPVNARLNELARELKAGSLTPGAAARSFLESVRAESSLSRAAGVRAGRAGQGLEELGRDAGRVGLETREPLPGIRGQGGVFDDGPARPAATPARAAEQDWDAFDRAVGDLQASLQEQAVRAGRGRSNAEVVRANELARAWKEELPAWHGRATDDQVEAFARRADELVPQFGERTARRMAVQEMFEGKAPSRGREPSLRGFDLADSPGPAPAASRLSQQAPGGSPARAPKTLPAPYEVQGQPVKMGQLELANRLPMPALVRLVREATGKVPVISEALKELSKKLGAQARGRFFASGKKAGRIELHPDLFQDTDVATQVLGHEIGHLLDMLGGSVRKGTVLADLSDLKNGLRTAAGRLPKEVREELIALSEAWRPYDKANSPRSFVRYRESTDELIADALSLMVNNLDEFQRQAPKFAKLFIEHMDRTPKLKQSLVNVYDWATGRFGDVADDLQRTIATDFIKGEDLMRGMREELAARRLSFWEALRQMYDFARSEFSDVGGALKRKASRLEDAGESIPVDFDPRITFDEANLLANGHYLVAQRWGKEVAKTLERAGVESHELGQFMLYQRIKDGDRAGLANPHGLTTHEARELLDKMEQEAGPEKWAAMETAARAARDIVWEKVEEGVKAGTISRELRDKLRDNRDTYATFAVLDHIDDQVPTSIKVQTGSVIQRQTGTFKGIANPTTAMLMKALSMSNHNAVNVAKARVVTFIERYFPDELREAARLGEGEFARPGRDKALLELWRDGKRVAYHVDPYIAEMFEKTPYDKLTAIAKTLAVVDTKLFKPLWIGYNVGFQAFNLVRDVRRTTTSLTALGVYSKVTPFNWVRTVAGYGPAARHAAAYASGKETDLLTEMIQEHALVSPRESTWGILRGDETQEEYLLRRYGGISQPEVDWAGRPHKEPLLKRAVVGLLDGVAWTGKFLEALPKVTGFQKMTKAGIVGPERAHNVRTFIGTPNFNIRGRATTISNSMLIFSNIFLQGWKADLTLLTRPKTRAGFIAEMTKDVMFPKMLMAAGASGLLGSEVKELYSAIGEDEKTHHLVIPLGWQEGGPFGKRADYLRLPYDETARLFGGLIWKLATGPQGRKDLEDWMSDVFTLVSGQAPGAGPTFKIGKAWLDVAKGVNPVDEYFGRPVVRPTEFEAGGTARWGGVLKWTLSQFGGPGKLARAIAFREDSTRPLVTEWPTLVPVLDRFYRVSDYGFREQQQLDEHYERKGKSKQKLSYDEVTQSLLSQYSALQRVGKDRRTKNQEAAYKVVRDFHSNWKKADEKLWKAEQDGNSSRAQALRDAAAREARKADEKVNRILGRERVER